MRKRKPQEGKNEIIENKMSPGERREKQINREKEEKKDEKDRYELLQLFVSTLKY